MNKFITLDGIDGVGKSTQIARLVDFLADRDHEVVSLRDPGSTNIGGRLRSILLDSDIEMHRRTEAMLFMASRCEMIEQTIRPALESGKTVISDRFLLATVVYQSTVAGEKTDTVPPDLLWNLGQLANGGIRPDITILLDMPADKALARVSGPGDRMESRGVEYMESVRQKFLAQLSQSSPKTVVVNADQPMDDVTKDMLHAVAALID